MPRFCANLTTLFTEYALPDRFNAAAEAGFGAVELLFPYDLPVVTLREKLGQTGQALVLINTPAGDWAAGDRGFAACPKHRDRFRDDFRLALRTAQTLNAGHIHIMAGIAHGPTAESCFLDNLAWATETAPEQPMTIEPLNPVDMPGYFLNDFDQAARILDAIGAQNLGLQFDAYHAHRITGDVMGTWARHGARVTHVQIADGDTRHEPQRGGGIDYPAFFAALDASGYTGYVSGEYTPKGTTAEGLGWMQMA